MLLDSSPSPSVGLCGSQFFLSLGGSSHSPLVFSVNRAPSVDADTLRLLTGKEIHTHTPSRFRAAARRQRPPGLSNQRVANGAVQAHAVTVSHDDDDDDADGAQCC